MLSLKLNTDKKASQSKVSAAHIGSGCKVVACMFYAVVLSF